MNSIDQAVYAKLAADATLGALLASPSSVYHAVAPAGAAAPLVLFQEFGAADEYALADRVWTRCSYLVKGVCEGPSAKRAKEIAERCDAVLTDQPLTVAGVGAMVVRRSRRVADYAEIDSDRRVSHAGAIYEIGVHA